MAEEGSLESAMPAAQAGEQNPWNALPGFRVLRALRTPAGLPRSALAVREAPGGFSRVCALEAAPDELLHRTALQALVQEAAFAARFRHPAVATVFDVLHPDGWVVVVRPVDGSLTLAHLSSALTRNANRLDERIVWHIAHTIYDCLDDVHHAHDAEGEPMCHGDLRPGHVVVRSDGSLVIRGFGGTREDWAPAGEAARRAMYQAPECLAGEPPSPAADVYSAAMIVWELLVEPSVCREAQRAFAQSRADVVVPPLAALRPDLPPAIAAAIDLCLSPDPDARSLPASAVATAIHRSVDVLTGRELLARMHANVLARLQGKPNPRWLTEPSRPGGVDCAAPTLRLARSTGFDPGDETPATTCPDLPLCVSPAEVASAAASAHAGAESDDESDTSRWERSDVPPPCADSDVEEEVTWPLASPDSAMARVQPPPRVPAVPVSSFPPVAKSDLESSPPPALPLPESGVRRLAALAIGCASVAATVGFVIAKNVQATDVLGATATGQGTMVAASRLQVLSAPSAPPAPASAASLPPIAVWRTRLIVHGPPQGMVFVQGVPAGETGQPLDVPCGVRYVRIGTRPLGGEMQTVRWLAAGRSVNLPCGAVLER